MTQTYPPPARTGDIGNEDVGLVQQIAALVSQGRVTSTQDDAAVAAAQF